MSLSRIACTPDVSYTLGGYRELAPPADLRDTISCVWTYHIDELASPAIAHRVLPDLDVSIAFVRVFLSGKLQSAELIVTGPSSAARFFCPKPGTQIVAIRIKPEWCSDVLRIDPAEHLNSIRPLRAIHRQLEDRLRDRLLRTDRTEEAAAILLHTLQAASETRAIPRDTRLAHAALENLRNNRSASVADAARGMGISDRHLRRVVMQASGIGPKPMQRILRLTRLIMMADRFTNPDWSRLSLAEGYFDQSHLVHETRALTGLTPSELHTERKRQVVDDIHRACPEFPIHTPCQ